MHYQCHCTGTNLLPSHFDISMPSIVDLRSMGAIMLASYISLFLFSSTILVNASPQSQRRCVYGKPCWPTEAEFSSLATQLSQPLLHPVPPLSPCHPSPEPPVKNCSEVRTRYTDGNWRSGQPDSMQNTNFEAYMFPNGTVNACYLNVIVGFPCKQGGIPPIDVDARIQLSR